MNTKELYLGIDVGSVSTKLVLMTEDYEIKYKIYLRTMGQPIKALKNGVQKLLDSEFARKNEGHLIISGVGVTGSGRRLAGHIVGADVVKNEITAHAVAAQKTVPDVRTIIEIGGQDSKIIFMDNTVVSDFSMNTVCAAGTGSFLDRQADRLNIPIEKLGGYALRSQNPVRIAGRCAVFAESDMIHKQQAGHCVEDIISGLCDALARNFINNLAKGKKIEPPVIFQGGVAANIGIVKAFEKNLQCPVIVPENYDVMGAFGCAILAREKMHGHDEMSNFYGFEIFNKDYFSSSVHCNDCPNICEIVEIRQEESIIARWGDRCGKWSQV